MSPPHLFIPFITIPLVWASQRAMGGFARGAGDGWETQGLAPGTAQLPEMFPQGLVNPQPAAEPGSSACRVWETPWIAPANVAAGCRLSWSPKDPPPPDPSWLETSVKRDCQSLAFHPGAVG